MISHKMHSVARSKDKEKVEAFMGVNKNSIWPGPGRSSFVKALRAFVKNEFSKSLKKISTTSYTYIILPNSFLSLSMTSP